ncbi:MAG: hypothetical protein KJ970_13995 [Candidatus Eisenbacteria bacterium]|uniref:Uncharacterized protein n=1 Tax=Eiseniibacteriota bacterium TaxID=2212470 RepID=A0A948RYN6_UNCEI|nr:hypothetical protein [Candidatus Eisenbacteria bacterium]MBU1948640.1 hypothetical protein [Candidatus Eisenbacteria bacterium]MBU2692027.1 hypothetical protein [Candidatus Eisenbacteria bacterium]
MSGFNRVGLALFCTILILGLSLSGPLFAACDEIDPLTLLPNEGFCSGWLADGAPGTAYTLEELTEFIDGGAFLHDQYGFTAAVFQNYLFGTVAASINLYNQGTAEGAEGLFNDPSSGMGDPVPEWTGSGEARFQPALSYIIFQFWEECFYGSIYMNPATVSDFSEVLCIATEILTIIQGAVPVDYQSWGSLKINAN